MGQPAVCIDRQRTPVSRPDDVVSRSREDQKRKMAPHRVALESDRIAWPASLWALASMLTFIITFED